MSRERFGSCSWAADNNQANLEKHGWSFQSAAIALEDGRPVPGNTREDGREERIASLNGETIKVVSERQGDETQIISAHKSRDLAEEYDAKAAEHGVAKNGEHNADFSSWRRLDDRQFRRAKPEVDIQREEQQAERQELKERTDLSAARRVQLQAQQNEQHRQEAVEAREPRLERDAQERGELARQQGRTVDKSLHVAGDVAGRSPEKLTDFVAGELEKPKEAPSQQPRTFSEAELATSAAARRAHDQQLRLQQTAQRDRTEALDHIAEDIKGGKDLNRDDVLKLSRGDLEGIRTHGDSHMKRLVHEREVERQKQRDRDDDGRER